MNIVYQSEIHKKFGIFGGSVLIYSDSVFSTDTPLDSRNRLTEQTNGKNEGGLTYIPTNRKPALASQQLPTLFFIGYYSVVLPILTHSTISIHVL